MRRGDEVCVPVTGKPLGKIVGLDVAAHTVDIEHAGRFADVRPERVFVRRMVSPKPKPAVLLEIGRWIAANGVDAHGEHRAARDLLLRRPPRLVPGSRGLAAEQRRRAGDAARHSRSPRRAARASGSGPPPWRRASAASTPRSAKRFASRSSSTTACCRSKARPAPARRSRART